MKLEFVEIQNFRKLKACRIDFSDRETLFVGANNSGKTSAMDALILFLKNKNDFRIEDFTISNWKEIDEIGTNWVKKDAEKGEDLSNNARLSPDLSRENWLNYLPQMDVWLHVEESEVHYVSHLIPTLDWEAGRLGVRLILEPKNIEKLHNDYVANYKRVTKICEKQEELNLWPKSLQDYLERKLKDFTVKAFVLDPSKIKKLEADAVEPQKLPADAIPIEGDPFDGIIKINIINAQRGFTDPNAEGLGSSNKMMGSLSSQLREYYKKHLDPLDEPGSSDLTALSAIKNAEKAFDERLKDSFESSIGELAELNYPGFGNPNIEILTSVNPVDGLNHASSVLFSLSSEENPMRLPEKYNGLGYQNLISMVFKVIRFRDEWMKVGKFHKNSEGIEPLHLVFIEEPEAHLHAQVQQVFIRKVYDVLRNHKLLKEMKEYKTQLVVSTHSNHIAHEVDFKKLRYFKRKAATNQIKIPTSSVVNLSKTFGSEENTMKFAIRYLKTTHYNLFFADAVIMVEGAAERILLPHFIGKKGFENISSMYIAVLEIGGSHAHRLKQLIEDLGIITLIITDIDSSSGQKSTLPKKGKDYKTSNPTLKKWLPKKECIDDLLDPVNIDKCDEKKLVRVAYQTGIELDKKLVYPSTFEDSLFFSNIDFFEKKGKAKDEKYTGLMAKFIKAIVSEGKAKAVFEALKSGSSKAEFALELLCSDDLEEFDIPDYIKEGLDWLEDKLKNRNDAL